MTHLTQMAGLAVQNFLSAAVGIAVAVALIRGLARSHTEQLGNFWVDLTRLDRARAAADRRCSARSCFIAAGMVQNLSAGTDVTTLTGGTQIITGGPVASQEVIKELGTNGGGFYNVNSSHPFENPTAWTNWLEIFLLGLIPFCLPRVFGRMVGDNRQGYAIVAAMGIIAVGIVVLLNVIELAAPGHGARRRSARRWRARRCGSAPATRRPSRRSTTLTSTGAVDSFHDSYSGAGRRDPAVQHDARRGRPRRRRLRAVRDARPGDPHRVRGRADGRPDPGVPGQEDRRPGDQVRLAVLPGHAVPGVGRHRGGHGQPRPTARRCSTPARTASPRCSTPSPRPATTTARPSPA